MQLLLSASCLHRSYFDTADMASMNKQPEQGLQQLLDLLWMRVCLFLQLGEICVAVNKDILTEN